MGKKIFYTARGQTDKDLLPHRIAKKTSLGYNYNV